MKKIFLFLFMGMVLLTFSNPPRAHGFTGNTDTLSTEDTTIVFKVWKTVKIGTHKTANEWRKSINATGQKIDDRADEIMNHPAFHTDQDEEEIQLVNVSAAELGLKKTSYGVMWGITYGEVCARARHLGLYLCQSEVGPALREEYKDQPENDFLNIGMETITRSNGNPSFFTLTHYPDNISTTLWLGTGYGGANGVWGIDSRFVFELPK